MAKLRKPFQGVLNIIRFNWHFYVVGLLSISSLFFLIYSAEIPYKNSIYILCILGLGVIVLSLSASFYIYDISGFYRFNWIEESNDKLVILNINAGFDETSDLLEEKFNKAELLQLDFYNPEKHTEVSIKRARKAYPPTPQTIQIKTSQIKLPDNFADKIFITFSAHEIRNEFERTEFFKEVNRILKPTGQIYVAEHLRDIANFVVYNLGFFHFYSKRSWLKIFNSCKLKFIREIKHTFFISIFILSKDGSTH